MSIALLPLEQADVPAYARLELKAFRSHPRIRMLWPRGYTDDLYAFYESNKNESLQDPECRMMKAVDNETGRIVAVSEWVFALDVEAQLKKDPVDPNATPPDNWPIDGNWPLRHFFTLNLEKWTKQYLKGKPYIKLEFLVTHPDFQRRGAGAKLLAWGTEQADKLGVLMALEATPAGMSLYKRFGFQEKEVIAADMKQFGWHEPYDPEAAKRVWMIREPADSEGKVQHS